MRFFSRWRWASWFGICIWLGSLLRLWNIGISNRWYDEIFAAWASVLPFSRMIGTTAGDVHPPLHYILIWAVAHLSGSSDTWLLRLPSALCSIVAMPLLILIGRRFKLSDPAILASLAFMAFAPFQIYYAQEIRMYALLQMEILLAVLAVLDRRWWLLCLASAAMIWTHNYGFVYCAVIYIWAGVREMEGLVSRGVQSGGNLAAVIASGVLALISYIPWAPVLVKQMRNVGNWWQQPTTPGAFLEPFQQFVWGNPLGMLEPISQIVLFGALAFSLWKLARLRSPEMLQVAYLAFIPMLFSVLTELVGMHATYLYRSFIGSSGFIYLLIGWAFTEQVQARERKWALAVLAPLFVSGVILYYPVVQVSKGATDTFLTEISNRMEPGDLVYHMNPGSMMSFRERYPNKPAMYMYVHPAIPNDIGTLSGETLDAFGVYQLELRDIPWWHRAWLIFSAGPTLGIAEDNEVMALAAEFHGQPIIDTKLWYSDVYRGQIWLLLR